jgi:hypothetical protein
MAQSAAPALEDGTIWPGLSNWRATQSLPAYLSERGSDYFADLGEYWLVLVCG